MKMSSRGAMFRRGSKHGEEGSGMRSPSPHGSEDSERSKDSQQAPMYKTPTKQELPPTAALEEAEARAAVLATELAEARALVATRDDTITDRREAHERTSEILEAMKSFQELSDGQDGGDRASRANLLLDMARLEGLLREEKRNLADLQKTTDRAKLGMFGLREQLRLANDTIDGARKSNEALLKPLKEEITDLHGEVRDCHDKLVESQGETKKAVQEKMDVFRQKLAAEKSEALAKMAQRKAEAVLASKEREAAETREGMEEQIANEVENVTSELRNELDEAYDRCEELSRETKTLKAKVVEMEAEALGDKRALVKARIAITDLEEEKPKLLDQIADAKAELTHLRSKVFNHSSVATEVGAVLREREERVHELERLCADAADDARRLCKLQEQSKAFTEHLQRIIEARDSDLSNVKEDLIVMTLRAKEQAGRAGELDKDLAAQKSKAGKLKEQLDSSRASGAESVDRIEALGGKLEEAERQLNMAKAKGARVLVSKATQTTSTGELTVAVAASTAGAVGEAATTGGEMANNGESGSGGAASSTENGNTPVDLDNGNSGSVAPLLEEQDGPSRGYGYGGRSGGGYGDGFYGDDDEDEVEGGGGRGGYPPYSSHHSSHHSSHAPSSSSSSAWPTLKRGRGKGTVQGRSLMVQMERKAAEKREKGRLEEKAKAISKEYASKQRQQQRGRQPGPEQPTEKLKGVLSNMIVREDLFSGPGAADSATSVYLPKIGKKTKSGGNGFLPVSSVSFAQTR